jgi:NAD(P)-dependent dehydrogenase (short-subunit alcohol dehydrogenase family)
MPAASLGGRRIVVTGGASGMGAGLVRVLPRMTDFTKRLARAVALNV